MLTGHSPALSADVTGPPPPAAEASPAVRSSTGQGSGTLQIPRPWVAA